MTDQPRGMVGGRHLPVAIAVGVVLAVVFLIALFWRSEAFTVVVAVVAATAFVDADRVLRRTGRKLLTGVLIATAVAMMLATHALGASGQVLGVGLLLAGCVVALLVDTDRSDVVRRLALSLLFGLWVSFLASYGVLLVTREAGAVVVLGVIGAAIFTDIGGYVFGVAFGRRKVVPAISPNKSWEGLIGGLALAALLAALVLPLLDGPFTPLGAALLAVVCGVASFVGDLTESMIKRDLDVKDLGDLLPGHGGVLDRVDGILFALPVGYYGVALFT